MADLEDFLNEWVAKCVASNPYDFIVKCSSCCKVALITCFGGIVKLYLDPIFDPSTHSPQKSWDTFRIFWVSFLSLLTQNQFFLEIYLSWFQKSFETLLFVTIKYNMIWFVFIMRSVAKKSMINFWSVVKVWMLKLNTKLIRTVLVPTHVFMNVWATFLSFFTCMKMYMKKKTKYSIIT